MNAERSIKSLLIGISLVSLFAFGCGPTGGDSEEAATGDGDLVAAGAPTGGNECEDTEPWAAGFQADHCTMADGGLPPIDPTLWPDVCTPMASQGWSPTQSSFDQLSWRSLLALSWPADPANPGHPDKSQPLGAESGGEFLPVVWETYSSADDLLASVGAESGSCPANGVRTLRMTSKVRPETIEAIGDSGMLGSFDQAFRGPLVDQNGKLVYYEIRINDVEYQHIIDEGAQNKTPAELNCAPPYDTPDCKPFQFLVGSIEVKAAWKQLDQSELDSGTFFSRTMQIELPSGGCETVPMGLVGLHIARKTEHSLNVWDGKPEPSWAWGTFEHAGNVPPVGGSGDGGDYSFFNAACTPTVTAEQCAAAAATQPNPDPAFQCCENLYRYGPAPVPADATPDQITRLDNPPSETATCNAVYAKTDLAIWQNYFLVTTQWPKGVEGPYQKVVTPTQVRNTTLESYFTSWQGTQQVNKSSCMGCHFSSEAVDMSYLFMSNSGG